MGQDGAGERRTMSSGACRVVRGTETAVGQRVMVTLFSVFRTEQANTNCPGHESSVSRWSKVSSDDLPHQQATKKRSGQLNSGLVSKDQDSLINQHSFF
jgi:hypothetical protein